MQNEHKRDDGSIDINQNFTASSVSNSEIINNRRMINGFDDGLMQVSPLKHPLSMDIFKMMMANTWMPQEVEMGRDIEVWRRNDILTERERTLYKRCLAFASNLDGILTDNIVTNITRQITSPEARLVCARQGFEEALHVLSYATLIEAIGLDSEEIYGMYRKDQILYEKNVSVLKSLAEISKHDFKTGTLENDQIFLEACTSYIILEGIYFYSVFLLFYILKRDNKMPGSAEMIQFINRDEDLHVRHFTYIINSIKEEQPEIWTDLLQRKLINNIKSAVELECQWGVHCMGDGVLGLNPANLKEYVEFIGNKRLVSLGLEQQWPNAQNPFPWIDEMTQGQMTETNFFEGRVREYASGTLDWDS